MKRQGIEKRGVNFFPLNLVIEDKEIELIMRYIKKIKAKNIDDNLKQLIINLINFEPKLKPNIEELYRNKWINQDYHIINDIISNFDKDIP